MFEYDSEKMDTVMSNMKTIKNNLEDNFDNIDKIMESISGSWEGEASNAFVRETTRAYYTYPSYVDTLDECIQYMKESNSSKADVEKKNESLISRLLGL